MVEFRPQTTAIIVGRKTRNVFDLSLEDQQTRDRYGHGWGQKVQLGRRLVESGVHFVTVGVPGSKVIGNWDDHAVNGDIVNTMSILVSGGGKRMGQVIGATNSKGPYPVERQFTPHDVLATMICQDLGVDHEQTYEDNSGHPIPPAKGIPIAEL